MDKYILDENSNPVLCTDLVEWGKWMQSADRHLADDTIGDVRVSTVFLGLDHDYSNNGEPILFETMIFGGEHDGYQKRYSTKEEALKGHKDTLALATN